MASSASTRDDSQPTNTQDRFSIIPKSVQPYKQEIVKWAIVGYIIRTAMMPLFSHADLIFIARTGLIMLQNHQLVIGPYPSFITLTFAFTYLLFGPFLPSSIVSQLTSNVSISPNALFSLYNLSRSNIITFLFISKIPYLIFDFALAVLLLHMIDDGRMALRAYKLWILNPIAIFISFAMGQFDIIPTFFFVLALYFYKKRKELSSIASIGICGAFKLFGLLFVLPMAIMNLKEHSKVGFKAGARLILTMLVVAFLPLAVSQAVTFLMPTYYESANVAWPLTQEIAGFFGHTFYSLGQPGNPLIISIFNYAVDNSIGFAVGPILLYSFPFVFALFLIGISYVEKWPFARAWKVFLVFLLAYYAFSFFNPQWFVLALPLLVLLVAENCNRYFGLYILLIPLFFILTFIYPDFLTSIFIPIIHRAFFWPTPQDWLNQLGLPFYPTISVFRTFFAAVCVIFIALITRAGSFWRNRQVAHIL